MNAMKTARRKRALERLTKQLSSAVIGRHKPGSGSRVMDKRDKKSYTYTPADLLRIQREIETLGTRS